MTYERVSKKLQEYVETHIFPEYALNDPGHQLDHIDYTIRRSLEFAATVPGINYDIVYTVAAYHDVAHHIDHKNHERLSAEKVHQDSGLQHFFTPAEISLIADAVYDHRSTMAGEPRSIYGKIISSADRNTSVAAAITRSYQYQLAHFTGQSPAECIEASRQHLLKKFGPSGYAVTKIYFPDPAYEKFLQDITALASRPELFAQQSKKLNNIN